MPRKAAAAGAAAAVEASTFVVVDRRREEARAWRIGEWGSGSETVARPVRAWL